MRGLADWLMNYGALIWLLESGPALLIAAGCVTEGQRLVEQSRASGNETPTGAKLLRFIGLSICFILLGFVAVGLIAATSPHVPASLLASRSTAMVVRQLLGTGVFLITPPLLGIICYRILRFTNPRTPV